MDKGQNNNIWTEEWNRLTPESEIRMWDFYGLRPWILKYAPRNGKVLEAGCGLGRYVFYLSKFGIDIIGLDFSDATVKFLNKWSEENNFNSTISKGNVCDLPFEDNSLSGYLSFGVIEHFIEGPKIPLSEAFRVLRPGGIAIISTPSVSWFVAFRRAKQKIKQIVKKIIGRKIEKENFFQYEYRPRKLKKLISDVGLYVLIYSGADLLYTFCELGRYKGENLKKGSFAYWFSNKFENTFINTFGAQSITIAVKLGEKMHCFICGELNATKDSLKNYTVPICSNCKNNKNSHFYLKNSKTMFHNKYLINPPVEVSEFKICYFCNKKYKSDSLFESYGFDINVCGDCLKNKEINIDLSNKHIQPIWRRRSNN